jgi:hypothetical protein
MSENLQSAKEKTEAEKAKIVLERLDLALAAQIDGLKSMQTRLGTLLTQSLTLASAAIALMGTVLSGVWGIEHGRAAPFSAQFVLLPGLTVLSVAWISAASVAAMSLQGIRWNNQGVDFDEFKKSSTFPTASLAGARLELADTLQRSFVTNKQTVQRYQRRLVWTIGLLLAGPLLAVAVTVVVILAALWSMRVLYVQQALQQAATFLPC